MSIEEETESAVVRAVERRVPDDQRVSVGVVDAAAAAGLDPARRSEPLASFVDPDALEDLVGSGDDRAGSTTVEFHLWGHPVRVAGRTVRVGAAPARPSP